MKWTDEQEKVIYTRGKDILVSAAAGSGKTAVLVERIIQRIISEDDPIDIDKLLVLTFTNDAAREMKDRVRRAIDKRLLDDPTNQRLIKQKTLVSYANITTIDSFCSYIVKNNFQEVGIDPNFRIIDDAEGKIFKQQAIEEVFEERYDNPTKEFLDLISTYKKKNSDSEIREFVTKIATKTDSLAWPEKWIKNVLDVYDVDTKEKLLELELVQEFFQIKRNIIKGCIEKIDATADEVCGAEYNQPEYGEKIRCDKDVLIPLLAIEDPFVLFDAMKNVKFATLRAPKGIDEDLKGFVKDTRDVWKNVFTKDSKILPGEEDVESIISEIKQVRPYVRELLSLVEDYRRVYQEKKDEVNGLDFTDLEHAALSILVDEDGNPTNAAYTFQNHYDEVMVDEYQDSNEVQETILKAVSGDFIGNHNYFCVGDVKQSIYGFRMADPSIFMSKFNDFAEEDEEHIRIDLNMNFRSRKEVLDVTNDVFSRIMDEDFGDVAYTEEVQLNYGADFLEPEGFSVRPELWYMLPDDEELEASGCDSKKEFEFRFIAQRIRALIDSGYKVQDKDDNDNKFFRQIRYSDIAILRRGVSDEKGEMTRFLEILREYGIDAVLAENKGYFETMEIETVLSFLEILDNPLKDIDLVSVLTSPIAGFSSDELLNVRRAFPEEDLFRAFEKYALEFKDEKVKAFLDFYYELHDNIDLSIADIIREIVESTGYMNYISSLPGGDLRRANVNKLIEEAEMSTAKSADLYTFMAYIRNRKKYDAEISMAKLMGEEDNVVRIMTIHKSKGLEFPVVFLSDCGKTFNERDLNSNIYVDPKIGLGLKKFIDSKIRIVVDTFYTTCMKELIREKTRAEEQRLLYVAMTRAKEKLIVTGSFSRKGDVDSAFQKKLYPIGEKMSFVDKFKGTTYFDWIIPSLNSFTSLGVKKYDFSKATIRNIVSAEVAEINVIDERKKRLKQILNESQDSDLDILFERMNYKYEFGVAHEFKNKYSVSEIKHVEIEKNASLVDRVDVVTDDMSEDWIHEEKERVVPRFISGKVDEEAFSATSYGTAMHRVLEGLDLALKYDLDKVKATIREMASRGYLTPEEADAVNPMHILKFLETDVARSMGEAAKEGRLLREQNFVFSERIDKLFDGLMDVKESEDSVLVQGEIDCLIVDDDGVTVIDYKTDRVNSDSDLTDRYSRQLQIYGNAASRTFAKPIKKLLIYSFALGRFIEVLPL